MTRKAGSGLANDTASAVEQLVAAVFADQHDVHHEVGLIDAEVAKGRCGVSGSDTERWVRQLANAAGLDVRQSHTPSPDFLGDVRLDLHDGSTAWIEVKAQTTKVFGDLLQADWVRDETDALRWVAMHYPDVRDMLSPWVLDSIAVHDPTFQFGEFELEQLWLADLGLLPDRPRRATAGVRSTADLANFLQAKYILHLTSEGARLARLDGFECVQRILDGDRVHLDVEAGSACDARIWVAVGEAPRRGAIDFIYYVGYEASYVVGRHKLHPRVVASADGLIIAR